MDLEDIYASRKLNQHYHQCIKWQDFIREEFPYNIPVDIDRGGKKGMRITMKGFTSLNYNLIFKILCMPKIIPFACQISLLWDLCVLSVPTSLPESQDAPDDLVYVLWFVQSNLVWSPGSNQIKGRKAKILCNVEGWHFFYIINKRNISMTKNNCYLNLTQGSNAVIEESAQPPCLILAMLES